jgi:hypothetical protein
MSNREQQLMNSETSSKFSSHLGENLIYDEKNYV